MIIRDAMLEDAPAMAAIYEPYVLETPITFEETPPSGSEMATRIEEVKSLALPWLVVEEEGRVAGYAYASRWKGRCAYRLSVEATIYLDEARTGRGLGSKLYAALLARLEERKLHAVIGGITLPNPASVALHEKLGFVKVAHFPEVGFKFGRFLDVGYWQKTFESLT